MPHLVEIRHPITDTLIETIHCVSEEQAEQIAQAIIVARIHGAELANASHANVLHKETV